MSKLLNKSLKQFVLYSALVLIGSIPVYYFIMSRLWQYELGEHEIVLTKEAGREDSMLIILAVTSLTVLFFALLMIGFILLNKRISSKLWQPFYSSLDKIRGFDLVKEEAIKFDETDINEFNELNTNLQKLIAGNVAVFRQQKEFADNASHELQTPLAIIQSKLDLLMQADNLSADQYKLIEEANAALTRVSRINRNLLLLTKIENSQYMQEETINISISLLNALRSFSSFAEDKQLDIREDIDSGIMVKGNKVLVEILLNNLINNAIRHSPPASIISFQLNAKQLSVSNAGNSALNQGQLFKRFAASSADTPGTGLGLALVQQIANRYHWKIGYAYHEGRHQFTVSF